MTTRHTTAVPVDVGVLDGYIVAATTERFQDLTSQWWHAWTPAGAYAGQTNDPRWLRLLIADHAGQ